MRFYQFSIGILSFALCFAGPCWAATVDQTAEPFHFRFTEPAGPFGVGLRVVDQYDRTRDFQIDPSGSHGPRPLQILIWYPAVKSGAKKMTMGDYGALIKTETSFDTPMEHGKVQDFVNAFMHGTETALAWAARDAMPESGHFPLVIYAPSVNAPSTENIELCEFLASYGFVVIAGPDMGAATRNMTTDVAGANAGATDISFEIDYGLSLPNTEKSKVGVIGYSWGGMSALFAAERDKRIGALVSLDGSFRYAPDIVQQAGDVHPNKMTTPLLVFSRAEEPLEAWDGKPVHALPAVLNQWHGDMYHLHMLAMSHIQFSSLYQRSQRFAKEGSQFSPADYSLEEGAESYNWVALYTLEFLDSQLKQDTHAAELLENTPRGNGVPAHFIFVTHRTASADGK